MNLQQCNICGDMVSGYKSVMDFVFADDTTEKLSESVKLTCGCTMDFATFNINFKSGVVEIVSELTGDMLVSYYDADIQDYVEDEDD